MSNFSKQSEYRRNCYKKFAMNDRDWRVRLATRLYYDWRFTEEDIYDPSYTIRTKSEIFNKKKIFLSTWMHNYAIIWFFISELEYEFKDNIQIFELSRQLLNRYVEFQISKPLSECKKTYYEYTSVEDLLEESVQYDIDWLSDRWKDDFQVFMDLILADYRHYSMKEEKVTVNEISTIKSSSMYASNIDNMRYYDFKVWLISFLKKNTNLIFDDFCKKKNIYKEKYNSDNYDISLWYIEVQQTNWWNDMRPDFDSILNSEDFQDIIFCKEWNNSSKSFDYNSGLMNRDYYNALLWGYYWWRLIGFNHIVLGDNIDEYDTSFIINLISEYEMNIKYSSFEQMLKSKYWNMREKSQKDLDKELNEELDSLLNQYQ